MTKYDYRNDSTPAERRQVIKDSAHNRAVGEQGTITGRYGAVSKTVVIGSEPVTSYPCLPSGPWANDPVGLEPPLGVAIDDHPPVGEAFEVESSLRSGDGGELHAGVAGSDEAQAPLGGKLSADASRQPRRSFKSRKKRG